MRNEYIYLFKSLKTGEMIAVNEHALSYTNLPDGRQQLGWFRSVAALVKVALKNGAYWGTGDGLFSGGSFVPRHSGSGSFGIFRAA